ncbi:VOC family protein [Streptococcus iniae]
MKVSIEHIGLWVNNLEAMKEFYCQYFEAQATKRYHNPKTGFSSYFLNFGQGTRLELMHKEGLNKQDHNQFGLIHLAFSLGSREKVDAFAYAMQDKGYPIENGPRTTGDGYYEAVITDPEGNKIEVTI